MLVPYSIVKELCRCLAAGLPGLSARCPYLLYIVYTLVRTLSTPKRYYFYLQDARKAQYIGIVLICRKVFKVFFLQNKKGRQKAANREADREGKAW